MSLVLALLPLASRAQDVAREGTASAAGSQDASVMQLEFSLSPKIPEQAPWTIRLSADHSGTYREQGAAGTPQPIHVSDAVWTRLDAGVAAVRGGHCETKLKGIAQTGMKTMSVAAPDAPVSCTFNYSDDEKLNEAASAFLAIAETIHEGAKLQHDHRFDKLALDADIDTLVSETAAGRALEPGNIAPVLRSLAEDERVIDRVRRKAARLLQDAGLEPPTVADKPR